MPRPDEGLIHAWLDGELSPDEAARVEQLVRDDAEWSAAAAEARGLVAASSRILGALDDVPGDVMPRGSRASGTAAGTATPGTTKPRVRFAARPWVRAAAGVVLVIGTTVAVRSVRNESTMVAADTAMPAAASMVAETAATVPMERLGRVADADVPAVSAKTSAPRPAPQAAARRAPQPAPQADADLAREVAPSPAPSVAPMAAPMVAPAVARAEAEANKAAEERARTQLDLRAQRLEATASARGASERILSSPNSISGLALQPLAPRLLEGCWQRESAGTQDTLLTALAIVRASGDSLELRLDTAGRTAIVLRSADTLRGTDRRINGASAPFVAIRVECP